MLFLCAIRIVAGAGFPVGIEYSRQVGAGIVTAGSVIAMAVDGAGGVYILAGGDTSKLPVTTTLGSSSVFVAKFGADGTKLAYLTVLPDSAHAIAADAAGNVYLAGPGLVWKLNPAGTMLVYTAAIGDGVNVSALRPDSAGHLYVTGWTGTAPLKTTPGAFQQTASLVSHAYVVKLDPSGAVEFATYVAGSASELSEGLAVDGTGAAVIRGRTLSLDFPVTQGAYQTTAPDLANGVPFVVRLAPDGSRLLYSTLVGTAADTVAAVAADAAGNTVIADRTSTSTVSLLRLDPHGALAWQSRALPPVNLSISSEALAIDAAGNVYLTGLASTANYPVKDSLAQCGSVFVSAFDATGMIVQSTFIAGATGTVVPGSVPAAGADGAVYIVGPGDGPTAPLTVSKLSTAAPVKTVGLACVGNAASFDAGSVAPGEIISLFGQGLGPVQGVQPDVTMSSGFPSLLAHVQVTFDGTPGPLVYVQDGQINAIAPWKLTVGQSTAICVTYNGGAPNCIQKTVAAAAPGVFTVDGIHAAALNEDGTVNSPSNPAKTGTIVSIFATGLGALTPTPTDGAILDSPLPSNTLPIMLYSSIGGAIAPQLVAVPTQYAGQAPLEVAGVSQINFRAGGTSLLIGVGPQLLVTDEVRNRGFSIWVGPH
jgi:uncharacterized protein (TIGR03437 family)